ncbi:hypothetical protein Bdt_1400 [Bdellovibrio bacteriovorus str. Tiberius]|uniref:Uncharacterized protein n=1 Tax=Bdellovibrio bacteriovorus str. Tiberius TaxID=1069642 RepID=K7YTY7_BDEBC|nr:hypothetical protein Bdt_1400 [Bdellovibrio bacteriovorus str. Tiberius]
MGQRKFAGELGQCQREGGFVGARTASPAALGLAKFASKSPR